MNLRTRNIAVVQEQYEKHRDGGGYEGRARDAGEWSNQEGAKPHSPSYELDDEVSWQQQSETLAAAERALRDPEARARREE